MIEATRERDWSFALMMSDDDKGIARGDH